MIRDAVAVTRWKWAETPDAGMISFIDCEKVKPIIRRGKATWGYSWLKAGFEYDGFTEGGLLAVRLSPERMPEPLKPRGMNKEFSFGESP
jgi:hypothetical protein